MAANSISIVLDNPKAIYVPGDKITGIVKVKCLSQENLQHVQIIFSGRGKTRLTRSNGQQKHVWRGRSPLFIQSKLLYQGHYTLKPNEYTWPFEFVFPSHSDARLSEDHFRQEFPFVATGVSHPLPPSFINYAYRAMSGRDKGKVEYTLEAKASRDKVIDSSLEYMVMLNFRQKRNTANPDLGLRTQKANFLAQTIKLLPESNPSFKEKMHAFFHPSDLPRAAFCLQMVCPTVTFPGALLPLGLTLLHMETANGVQEDPEVYLNSIVIKIKTAEALRAGKAFGRQVTGNTEEEFQIFQHVGRVKLSKSVTADKQSSVSQLNSTHVTPEDKYLRFPGLKTPLSICPDFSTINVAISHRLKVKLQFSCAEKSFSQDFTVPLSVISSEFRESAPSYTETLPVYQAPALPAYQPEGLPAYEKQVTTAKIEAKGSAV
jgi:hypothetical protein